MLKHIDKEYIEYLVCSLLSKLDFFDQRKFNKKQDINGPEEI